MMSPARYSKKCNEHLALRRSSTTACKAVALNRFRDLLTVHQPPYFHCSRASRATWKATCLILEEAHDYSQRSASIGSTFVARRAGIQHARSATHVSNKGTAR